MGPFWKYDAKYSAEWSAQWNASSCSVRTLAVLCSAFWVLHRDASSLAYRDASSAARDAACNSRCLAAGGGSLGLAPANKRRAGSRPLKAKDDGANWKGAAMGLGARV